MLYVISCLYILRLLYNEIWEMIGALVSQQSPPYSVGLGTGSPLHRENGKKKSPMEILQKHKKLWLFKLQYPDSKNHGYVAIFASTN